MNWIYHGTVTGRYSSKEHAVDAPYLRPTGPTYLFVGGPLDGERQVVLGDQREFRVQWPENPINSMYRAVYGLYSAIRFEEPARVEVVYLRQQIGATISVLDGPYQRHVVYVYAGRRRISSPRLGDRITYNGEYYTVDDTGLISVEATRPLRALNGSHTIIVDRVDLYWDWPTETWRVRSGAIVHIEDDIKEVAP